MQNQEKHNPKIDSDSIDSRSYLTDESNHFENKEENEKLNSKNLD